MDAVRIKTAGLLAAAAGTVLLAVAYQPLIAQERAEGARTSLSRVAQGGQLDVQALLDWNRIMSPTMSWDGRWFGYILSPNEGNSRTILRDTRGEVERSFESGNLPGGGITFSDNSQWAVFSVQPTVEEEARLEKEGKPVEARTVLLNLYSAESRNFEKVRRFGFNGRASSLLAVHRQAASGSGGAGGFRGSDLILHDLATGLERSIGNVAEWAFDSLGNRLFYVIDARDRVGNAIMVRDLRSGEEKVLQSQRSVYNRLTWIESQGALLLSRRDMGETGSDTVENLLLVTNVGRREPTVTVIRPDTAAGFPPGMRVSRARSPSLTRDGTGIYFSVTQERTDSASAADSAQEGSAAGGASSDVPNLVLWHWQDSRLQRQQELEASSDTGFSFLAVYWLRDRKVVQLEDSVLRQLSVAPGDRWGLASDARQYELQGNLDGQQYMDLYVVDLRSGEKRVVLRRATGGGTPSPDGERFLYYDDGHYYSYEFDGDEVRNLTQFVPTSFVNDEDDHNQYKPPRPPVGWSSDSRSILLSDGWDVWNVPVNGRAAVNLTINGKTDSIRYRGNLFPEPAQRGIDTRRPFYTYAYGEWTKKEGIARVEPAGRGASLLLWDDADISISKAREVDRYYYTRQTVVDFPDYYVTDSTFAAGTRITEANPQQAGYAWSAGARLVEYLGPGGQRLQGALYLPAGYQEGQAYPTVVYIYEKRSQLLHSYSIPNFATTFNPSVYTSRGYAVFQPDIVYQLNDPGMSAVWCVVPAVEAAIATGIVDRERIGLHGHSWGGYQTAFLITQTNLFRAAVAGAPLTNLVSMYSSIYWNTGTMNAAIFEASQGRFAGGFWEHHDAYVRNSPVFHATNVETPLLMLHNDQDGAVDFNQGIEYYNTLRRLGKPVVLLQYVGENHGLSNRANQKDYSLRMREFFDHYLRGAGAPEWWTNGVPRVKMADHLRERAALVKPDTLSRGGGGGGGGTGTGGRDRLPPPGRN